MSRSSPKPDSSVASHASTATGDRERAPHRVRDGLRRRWPRSLTDGEDAAHLAGRSRRGPRRECFGGQSNVEATVVFDDLAAQRLAERRRRLRHLLAEVVRGVTTVDVAGRDLGSLQLVVGDRQHVPSYERRSMPACRRHSDDLTLRRRVAGLEHRLAVETDVPVAYLDDAVRLARDDVRRRLRRRRAPGRSRAAPAGSLGLRGGVRGDRNRPSNAATVARNASRRRRRPRCRRETSAGITLASVVISAGKRSASSALRSAYCRHRRSARR